MDFKKYIIVENIPAFKLSMTDTKTTVSDPKPYEHYTMSSTGKARAVLSSSVKWNKVEGVEQYGVTGLYLAPATTVTGINTCKFAGKCAEGCIAFTGQLGMFHQSTMELRMLALYHHTERYLIDMLRALYLQSFKASIDDKELYCRLNGTSDLPFYKVLNMDLIVKDFNGLAGFYDYTKYPVVSNPWSNYHLTYSYSETTKKIDPSFDRVAIVVTKKDKVKLLNDYPGVFCDGDQHDIRALDSHKYVLLQGKRATAKDKKINDDFIQSYESVVALCLEVSR
mgnify:CR=1 FL=1|tara:strand:+ start:536 stop:1378 length:843 start_codon:yes stop_codon:yes gene_type:complete